MHRWSWRRPACYGPRAAQAAHCGSTLFQPKSACCDAQSLQLRPAGHCTVQIGGDTVTESGSTFATRRCARFGHEARLQDLLPTEQRTGNRQVQVVEYKTEQQQVTRPVYSDRAEAGHLQHIQAGLRGPAKDRVRDRQQAGLRRVTRRATTPCAARQRTCYKDCVQHCPKRVRTALPQGMPWSA